MGEESRMKTRHLQNLQLEKKKKVVVESFRFAPGLVVEGPQQGLLAQEENGAAAGDPLATAG